MICWVEMRVESIIVYERAGEWAAALRRPTASMRCRIVEATTFDVLQRELDARPASCVVIEARPHNSAETIEHVHTLWRRYPAAIFVIATEQDDPAQFAYYEAGATLVATCIWKLRPIVRLAQRHFACQPERAETLRETIWNALPWQDLHSEN